MIINVYAIWLHFFKLQFVLVAPQKKKYYNKLKKKTTTKMTEY